MGFFQGVSDIIKSAASTVGDITMQGVDLLVDGANVVVDGAIKVGNVVGNSIVNEVNREIQVVKSTAAAGFIAAEAAVVIAGAVVAKSISTASDRASAIYDAARPIFDPYEIAMLPCVPCLNSSSASSRARRIDMRNELIKKANKTNNPDALSASAVLSQDMYAVDMARLSDDVYNETPSPPEPWEAMSPGDLAAAGIDPEQIKAAKGRVYKLGPGFPGGPKVVLAFEGTVPSFEEEKSKSDLITNHDQALGLSTRQYTAAMEVGQQVALSFPNAEVTGHSLGGGKAQAAGAAGGLSGIMFNSAGLHPSTVPGADFDTLDKQFIQYRASGGIGSLGGDPLTGLQNSQTAQSVLVGTLDANVWAAKQLGAKKLSPENEIKAELLNSVLNETVSHAKSNKEKYGYHIPPARGRIVETQSLHPSGKPVGADPGGQHSVKNLINGIEGRKFSTIKDLLRYTGVQGNAQDYLGPVTYQLQ